MSDSAATRRFVVASAVMLIALVGLTAALMPSAAPTPPAPGNIDLQTHMGIRLAQAGSNAAPKISMRQALELASTRHPGLADKATSISAEYVLFSNDHHLVPDVQGDLEAVDQKIPVWIVTYQGVIVPTWGGTKPGIAGTELNVVIDAATGEEIGAFSYR